MKVLIKFIIIVFIVSCNTEYENELDLLKNEIKVLKEINKLNDFKLYINNSKISENLVTSIEQLDNNYMIKFENEDIINVKNDILLNFSKDEINWNLRFFLTDSSIVETFYQIEKLDIKENDIILNPYKNSPLTALVKINLPLNNKYGYKVVGQDGSNSDIIINSNSFSKNLEIKILGLYPDYNNEIKIYLKSKNDKLRVEKSIFIKTEKQPNNFPVFEIIKNYNEPQLNTLFMFEYRPIQNPLMVDVFGKIRWYTTGFTADPKYALSFLKNGNIIYGQGTSPGSVIEFNLFGKLINEYKIGPDYDIIHHDVVELPNGNLLATVNKLGIPTIEDHIIEIDRNSKRIIREWDLRKILPTDRFDFRFLKNGSDWFHNNAVIYDEKDNSLILSGQTQGVVKVSWNNELKWILAPHVGWSDDYKNYLLKPPNNQPEFDWTWGQHTPLIKPNGNLMLFDNGFGRNFGNSVNNYSRAVEYNIIENSNNIGGHISQVWEYGKERGDEMFSPIISDVDFLEKTNTIYITSGSLAFELNYEDSYNNKLTRDIDKKIRARMIELDYSKNVKFEMILKTDFFSAVYRSEKINLSDILKL